MVVFCFLFIFYSIPRLSCKKSFSIAEGNVMLLRFLALVKDWHLACKAGLSVDLILNGIATGTETKI